MIYEPGSSDIFTTLPPPFPPDDNEILANLFRQLLAGPHPAHEVDARQTLLLRGGHCIHLRNLQEVEAVRRAQADVQRGMARRETRRE